jgi:hypothetical protein
MTRSTGTATAWAGIWTGARAAMAVVIVAAVVAQAITTIGMAAADGRHVPTTVANFFSFFTILSNSATAIVLGWAALRLLVPRRVPSTDPPALAVCLVCVTTYMLITGVVYNVLLRAVSIGPDTVGWANEVMHVWAPLFLLADLFVGPVRRALPWAAASLAVVFPVVWIAYTLIRAPFITAPTSGSPYWYPYPFLDPNGPAGWGGVWGYIVGIAIGIVAVAVGVVAVGRRRGRSREAPARS